MKICLVQYDIVWHKPALNFDKISELVRGNTFAPDLYVFPEMFTTGFTMDSEACAESMDGASVQWMKGFSVDHRCAVTGSLIVADDKGSFYNRSVWIENGELVGYYDKRHLFAKAGEDQAFTAGQQLTHINKDGLKFCPLICYDLRFPVWSRNTDAYDVLLYVANWPAVRRDAWKTLLKARAIENQCYAIGLNRVGLDGDGLEYVGDSMVIDPYGVVQVELGNKESIANVTLDKKAILECRRTLPFLRDRDRFDLML